MDKLRKFTLATLAMSGFICYAAAGFADAYHDRQVRIELSIKIQDTR